MRQFSTILLFLFLSVYATAQSSSGFQKGDKELIRFYERKLVNQSFNDTASYVFTTAALVFDQKVRLDTIRFMDDAEPDSKTTYQEFFLKQTWVGYLHYKEFSFTYTL